MDTSDIAQYRTPRERLDDACESPIEQYFIDAYYPYREHDVRISTQRVIQVPHTRFRLDFLLTLGSRRVAIECDGYRFHNPVRDGFRDALILGSGLVEGILRFPGWALTYLAEDCAYTLSRYYPEFFSSEGRDAIARLADPHVRELIDPPKRLIRCDIRESTAACHIPHDPLDLDEADRLKLKPFTASHISFDPPESGLVDLEHVYKAILLGRYSSFTQILEDYDSLAEAEADFIHVTESIESKGQEPLRRMLRLSDAEYKMSCHFVDGLPRPSDAQHVPKAA